MNRLAKKPLYKIEFKSAWEAMIDFGVQVFFVNEQIFEEIKKSKQKAQIKILKNQVSENQRRNKNIFPFY